MIAFKDLKEILEITIRWENKLKDFYDVAEFAMKSERLVEKLGILSGVDLAGFGKTEWVRYAPAYREEELIPVGEMHRNATPQEIFTHLLDYEDKLKKTYAGIAANLISRSQKELFESLVQFKEEQSEEVRRLMESYGSGS
jgi:hypothetical protein